MSGTNTTPDAGVSDYSEDNGEAAFLSSFEDEDPKNKVAPSEGQEEAPEQHEETGAEPEQETGDGEAPDPDDPDNAETEVKVGEETHKVTIKELKRLFGQEKALTQKSQHASEQLKAAEAQIQRATVATKALLDRAKAAYEPYEKINNPASWAFLATQMSPEDYQQLQRDSATAEANVKFLTSELDGYVHEQQQQVHTANVEASKAAIKELTDPEKGIQGFGPELYNEMVGFADKHGVPEFRTIVSPAAIRIVHMAMLYAKGQEAAKRAEAKVKAAVDKPQRVLKPGATRQNTPGQKVHEALKALRNNADDPDAAADAFAATF